MSLNSNQVHCLCSEDKVHLLFDFLNTSTASDLAELFKVTGESSIEIFAIKKQLAQQCMCQTN